ncbi:MAG: hypothetical protein H6832_08040 [Planctomycetes bacterium]|nr:hypothetical protein [Planctomycetota bacterium]MCB9918338.1 hypothetical protein [Planctomycetota bacterium]
MSQAFPISLSSLVRKLTAVAASLALAVSASAQLTQLATGKVEKLPQPSTCSPSATHKIACTDIHLVAGTGVDLGSFEGQTCDMEVAIQIATCPTLRVDKIAAAKYSVRMSPFLGGQNRIGDTISIRQTAPLLAIVPAIFAGKPGFLPLGEFGLIQSDPATMVYIQNDVALLGFTLAIIKIPNDKALVGAFVMIQGLYIALANNAIDAKVLNVDCVTIRDR